MLSTGMSRLFELLVRNEVLTVHLCSKQARRTGMAGPLGEMFDHGIFNVYPSPARADMNFCRQDVML